MREGLLYVTMQPSAELPAAQFHDWYNNEHGPTRLKLDHIFFNGFRYRAIDGQKPEYLAVYGVDDMKDLESPVYTTLREHRSPREAATISRIQVNRQFWTLCEENARDKMPFKTLKYDEVLGQVMIAITTVFKPGEGTVATLKQHMANYTGHMQKRPGWRRMRTYEAPQDETDGTQNVLLTLLDFECDNGLSDAANELVMWRQSLPDDLIISTSLRMFELFYVFCPGSVDLKSLSELPDEAQYHFMSPQDATTSSGSPITMTKTGPNPTITSWVNLPRDKLLTPYQLEGNPDPKALTVVFCNSLLTSMHMWDSCVDLLRKLRPEFRFLRYDMRGRHKLPLPPTPSTLDILSDDLISLLDMLHIPRVHAVVGVSMGGATALNTALKHPQRLDRFVACDFNVASSAANTAAWKERIAIAETLDENQQPGITKLASMTVERWFCHSSMASESLVQWMNEMVATNDVEGFRYGCQALWDYDLKEKAKHCSVPGLLVVGRADGKGNMVKAMEGFKELIGSEGVELNIVDDAGHLPMCENPRGFVESINSFL